MRRTSFRAIVLMLGLCASAVPAIAQEPPADKSVVAAANAFAQAQEAELGGEHAHAAELFELADRIAPTPEALRSATRARLHAGELATAAGHAEELLRRYGSDAPSRELAEQVLTRARPELTRFRLSCEAPCTVVVDGLASGLAPMNSQILYAKPGSHEFVVGFEGGLERSMRLQGERGEALSIKVQRPSKAAGKPVQEATSAAAAAPSAAPAPPSRWAARPKLPPVYFWGAVGATAVMTSVAIWSGVDLLKARDEFESAEQPTRDDFEAGERKDLRTGLLIGSAGVLAAGTIALGLFTDFHPSERTPTATVSFDGHGFDLRVRARF